jgi:hypothetical protein
VVILFFLIKGAIPVPIKSYTMWSPDSTAHFKYTEYTLGVFGGGYSSIEIGNEEILRYDYTEIYGRWIDNSTIKLISNRLPTKNWLKKTKIKFELIPATSYDDFINDSLLVHLTKVAN